MVINKHKKFCLIADVAVLRSFRIDDKEKEGIREYLDQKGTSEEWLDLLGINFVTVNCLNRDL